MEPMEDTALKLMLLLSSEEVEKSEQYNQCSLVHKFFELTLACQCKTQ